MTREEAIFHIKDVICENNTIKPNIVIFEQEKEALHMAIKALEQDTAPFDFELYQAGLMDMPKGMIEVLDKIRAEIEQLAKDYDKYADYRRERGLWIALEIIDKYRKEHPDETPL